MIRAAGVIAEFDPFHNGHKYLLDTVHAKLPSHALVCVMSGNFVQRGNPAICDKYTRAKAAVLCGADLVLELPFVYAVNSAQYFAEGGVKVLKAAGCDAIAFGSESGDLARVQRAAELSAEESGEFKERLRAELKTGTSYANAYSAALSLVDPASDGLRDTPNDLLAAEYLKQNILQGAGLEPLCVKRFGAMHDAEKGTEPGFSSASAIRANLGKGNKKNIIVDLPEAVHELALSTRFYGKVDKHRYFQIIRYSLMSAGSDKLSGIYCMNEGLENAFTGACLKAPSTNDLIMAVKSRRYTYARLARLLVYTVCGLSAEDASLMLSSPLPYIRPLAFNERGAAVLKAVRERGETAVISNVNRYEPASLAAERMLHSDMMASDIYSIITGISLYDGSDRVRSPFVLKG